jgi:Tol biopolymer transport system component/DNA-binding winged helix-turn-helix (wHTH) protein
MPIIQSPVEKVRFSVFELDLRAGELLKEGQKVKLQEQPFRVLFLLLQRAGEVVTRDELRQDLWPADTFVDFDHGLNSAVARLREALRDSAEKPRFIETVAKRGYRFIAPIRPLDNDNGNDNNEDPPGLASLVAAGSRPPSARLWIAATISLALVCSASIWALYRPRPDAQLAKIEVVPLIGLRGYQATPAFSPDGTLVAFRQSDGGNNTGIYAAVAGAEKSIQLTNKPGDCCPTWSPDGRQIAFVRYSRNSFAIFTMPALGGTERRLYQGPDNLGGGLSWSPDGSSIAFSESHESDPTKAWISVLSVADSSIREISSPPPGWIDRSPSFSPDGNRLAFIRSAVAGVSNDLYVMAANGGPAKRLTFDHRPMTGSLAWTSDSREIVFASARGAQMSLWVVAADGCIPKPVAGPVGEAEWPTIPSRTGNTLVYERGLGRSDVWRLDLKDAEHPRKAPFSLISEKGDKMRPELSPDGKKVAFESDRLGFWDLWSCDVDGSSCDQITSLHGTAGRARWSPDAHYIAFEFHPHERSEIYVVEVPGGVPRLVPTIPGSDNLSPSWSRDGKSIYFASKRDAEPFQIWKIAVQGGTPLQLTKHGGISPVESFDGRYLYYSKYEHAGIWRKPLQDGGEESEVLSDVESWGWPNWALSPEGIYFLKAGKLPRAELAFFDFAAGKTHVLSPLEKDTGWGLSLSADRKSIVYVQNQFAESNLMLVRNFR